VKSAKLSKFDLYFACFGLAGIQGRGGFVNPYLLCVTR